MRREVLMLLSEEGQAVQEAWSSYEREYIKPSEMKNFWTPTIAQLPMYSNLFFDSFQ